MDDTIPLRGEGLSASGSSWPARLAWFAIASAGLVVCVYLVRKSGAAGEDSWFPMSRAIEFLRRASGGQLYQTLFFSEHIKFQYPPSALLSLDFLRQLGMGSNSTLNAINVWLAILTGLSFSMFAVRMLGRLQWRAFRIPVGPIAFLIAMTFYPNRLALQFGQIQVLLGLLFMLSCWALTYERHALAGVLIACITTVKPQFLLLGLLMAWQRDWRFFAAFLATSAVALILSLSLYGWQSHVEYFNVLAFLSQHGEYHHLNQSINGILNRYLYDGPSVDFDPDNPVPNSGFPAFIPMVYLGTTVTSLILMIIPFAIQRTQVDRTSTLLGFCLAAVLFTMASPIAWVHHYNVLLPAYVLALKVILDKRPPGKKWLPLATLALSLILTGLPLMPPFGPTIPSLNLVQSHVFFGAVLLVGLMLFELRLYRKSLSDEANETMRPAIAG